MRQSQPDTVTTTYLSPVVRTTQTTTIVSQPQGYATAGTGGWIGSGENRIWVPNES
jgi:hypothetical protein